MQDWIRSRQGERCARPLSAPCAEYKNLKDASDVAGGCVAYYSTPLRTSFSLTRGFPALRPTRDCELPPRAPFTYSSCSLLRLFSGSFRRSTRIGLISSPSTAYGLQEITVQV